MSATVDRLSHPTPLPSIAAGCSQSHSVGTKSHIEYNTRVTREREQLFSGFCIPHFRRSIKTAGRDVFPIGTKRDRSDGTHMTRERQQLLARLDIPYLENTVAT